MIEKSRIDRAGDRAAFIVERLLALGLLAAIVCDFVNVLGRYGGSFSIIGLDEIEIYTLIAIAFLGGAVVSWRNMHLRMDVFISACPPAVRRPVILLEMLVTLAVVGFVAWHSFGYVARVYAFGTASDIAHVPMWIPHSAVLAGFALIAVVVLVRGVQRLAGHGGAEIS